MDASYVRLSWFCEWTFVGSSLSVRHFYRLTWFMWKMYRCGKVAGAVVVV